MTLAWWRREQEAKLAQAQRTIAALLPGLDGPDRQRILAAIRAEAKVLLLAATVLDEAERKRR